MLKDERSNGWNHVLMFIYCMFNFFLISARWYQSENYNYDLTDLTNLTDLTDLSVKFQKKYIYKIYVQ